MARSSPSAAESASAVSATLDPRAAEMSADIYGLIVAEIPQLRSDKRMLALLESSVAENVATALHILQHGIDLEKVRAPAAAEEYTRRLAQRGVPIAALLRAYRIGSARFEDWCLQELGRQTDNAAIVSAAGLRIARVLASYIDQVSEEVYLLRQHHLGVVTWITGAPGGGDALGRLEHLTAEVAAEAHCEGRPIFIPQDEFSAWAWLPLGARHDIAWPAFSAKGVGAAAGIRFAFGEPALGLPGFRRTHQQALAAQAVALAAGPSGHLVTSFAEVAPLALMSGSIELLQA